MVYRFDDFEFDLSARAVRKAGKPIAVEPKVFDLLHALMRNRRIVTRRDVLLSEIWPSVVVSEASLSRLVKEARRLIGDSGQEQRLIRTVRGTGYQFVGHITEPAAGGALVELDEAHQRINFARISLEAAVERGARDLRVHIEEFVQSCQLVLDATRPDPP